MRIRTKAGIEALPEGRIRELAETTLKVLNLQDFIEMEGLCTTFLHLPGRRRPSLSI